VTPHHEFKGPPQRTLLPPETEILKVFDHERIAGRLLILGPLESAKPRCCCTWRKNYLPGRKPIRRRRFPCT
jgi:hypothetical protein